MSTSHSSLPFAKRQSIGVRMAQALALFLLLVMAANYLVLDTRGRDVLVEQTNKLNDELGQKIILKLRERLAATETLTTSLANLGTVLEKDPDQFMRVVPHVMSQAGMDQLIAGGGIWPEPNTFAEGVERRSFFWGRNAAGVLEYFDDYNDPAGAGYHQEEWYVPARHLKPGQVYWSRSYMDPYSREP
ncbi:MAG: methyl-accepting chemotaxis protein, partial [Oleiphilaceae bacterium]|nr:methyl-accepting chemotaxis protein [Oleiphilaceae bacterium]